VSGDDPAAFLEAVVTRFGWSQFPRHSRPRSFPTSCTCPTRQLREASFAFADESQCPDSGTGPTYISFGSVRPKVAASGRFRFDDGSVLFTGALYRDPAVGAFGERALRGTKRFGWRAHRMG
jgi:hypothetical protein